MSERNPGWHTEGEGTRISVTCAESIYGLTSTDSPNAEDANTVITRTLILPESLKIAHLAGCGDRAHLPIFVCIGDNKREDYAMSAHRN